MIPEKPRKFDPASLEGLMFDALALLPDDYYVFHSLRLTGVVSNMFHESETDFVVFNRKKGIICLEAKAGQVRYAGGEWLYSNGTPMHNGGPFNQAASNKHKLRKYISESSVSGILEHCKFLHAVWFPSITDEQLISMHFPPEADKNLVLTKGALTDPEVYLKRIFDIVVPVKGSEMETKLSDVECRKLIHEVLCPEFEVFPTASFDSDLKKIVFHRLLKEQSNILHFLTDQKTAAINGAAGTGKTIIACRKALMHAQDGEKVLFLCFNSMLRDYLEKTYPHENISYFTISGFVCRITGLPNTDFEKARKVLEDMFFTRSFPYKHVIIDEGQDFGREVIEETDIIQIIRDIIDDNEESNSSFYVFYDKLQLIQADEMPHFIEDLDCKLTLYRNCRNTENIASTSLKPVTERKPKLFENAVKGLPAKLHYYEKDEDFIERLDRVLDSLAADGIKDIVILTCKTETSSVLSQSVNAGIYRSKYLFSTCRKYKGLEADAIVLIDLDENVLENDVFMYYVGTSRARLRLEIFSSMDDIACENVLNNVLHYNGRIKRPKKDLADALNAVGSIKD